LGQSQYFASPDVGEGLIDLSKPLGSEEVVQVFDLFREIVPENVGNIIVDAAEPGFRGAALGFPIKLVVEVDLVHGNPHPFLPSHATVLGRRCHARIRAATPAHSVPPLGTRRLNVPAIIGSLDVVMGEIDT